MATVDLMGKLSELRRQGVGKYLLVNVVAKRARALNDGSRAEIAMSSDNPMDYTRVALAEVEAEKIRCEPKERAGQLVDIAGIVK